MGDSVDQNDVFVCSDSHILLSHAYTYALCCCFKTHILANKCGVGHEKTTRGGDCSTRKHPTHGGALVGHSPSAPSTVNKALASAQPLEIILLLKLKKYKAEKYGNMEISKKKKKSGALSRQIYFMS